MKTLINEDAKEIKLLDFESKYEFQYAIKAIRHFNKYMEEQTGRFFKEDHKKE